MVKMNNLFLTVIYLFIILFSFVIFLDGGGGLKGKKFKLPAELSRSLI